MSAISVVRMKTTSSDRQQVGLAFGPTTYARRHLVEQN
jgi:hypothetical protein